MNSFKTIDGRGANVHIANGACITIQFVTNVIIHGLHIHDCKPTGNAMVRSSPSHYGWRTMADGDGVSIFGASHIWVDHNSLSNCADGLVDAVMGSTAITISNNYFTHHNEVRSSICCTSYDSYVRDKAMQVTIAFNHFGEGLIQRMPRHGYFHVVNNDYTHWEMYAIGGSADPTINSQGNRYLAPTDPFAKEVTKRVDTDSNVWKSWNWRSEGDLLLNGAYFTPSGAGASASYAKASSLGAKSSSMVGSITSDAGALGCRKRSHGPATFVLWQNATWASVAWWIACRFTSGSPMARAFVIDLEEEEEASGIKKGEEMFKLHRYRSDRFGEKVEFKLSNLQAVKVPFLSI
ncbi:hypothetical protein GW17_00035887 [Ensete ventricosum]|nr:hypothetical protein GW17_00035887 [Ensete ventricosum]